MSQPTANPTLPYRDPPVKALLLILLVPATLYLAIGSYIVATANMSREYRTARAKSVAPTPSVSGQAVPNTPITYEGIPFVDQHAVDTYIRERQIGSLYAWLMDLDPQSMLSMMATAFGLLGGWIAVLAIATKNGSIAAVGSGFWTHPLLGSLLGFVTLFVFTSLPSLLTVARDTDSSPVSSVNAPSVALGAIGAGAFSQRFLTWLEQYVRSMLPSGRKGQS